ncbi:MAG: ABC transporter ATP-binding protein [Elusimicrobia bacterium]|nr:ABC transporter ATP-binding protein [Elusimicrobiota bacterium]
MIQAKSISAGYTNFKLENINLQLKRKTFYVLAGPNASGKTTLIRALGGVIPLETGSLKIFGKSSEDLSALDRGRLISHIPAEFHSGFPFSVREIVMMGRNPHIGRFAPYSKKDQEIAEEAMNDAGCLELANRSITELSSGQRQLVLLARAISQDTPFMLLDEPASHLDPAQASRVYDLLVRLVERGKTLLAVMHDLTAASNYCENLILMKKGRIYAQGAPKEILNPELLKEVYGVAFTVENGKTGLYVSTGK